MSRVRNISLVSFSVSILLLAPIQACTSSDWIKATNNLMDAAATGSPAEEVTLEDITSAFKEALKIGASNVTTQLGRPDAFSTNPAIHIPVPHDLKRVENVLRKAGLGTLVDRFEVKLNRAAERAAPLAKDIFWQAIKEMTFSDIQKIYHGPEDAATRYFERKTTLALTLKIKPVIDDSLSRVGAIHSYDRIMNKYDAIPFVPDVKADISGHVIEGTLKGVFHYLAEEEAAIRKNPAKRTTALLKKVFGGSL